MILVADWVVRVIDYGILLLTCSWSYRRCLCYHIVIIVCGKLIRVNSSKAALILLLVLLTIIYISNSDRSFKASRSDMQGTLESLAAINIEADILTTWYLLLLILQYLHLRYTPATVLIYPYSHKLIEGFIIMFP